MAKVKIPFAVRDQVWTFAMEDHGSNDYIVNFIVRHGLAEYEKSLPLLLAGFALTFGETFLDIGANTGLYSFLYGTLAPDAVVHAFEPLPQIAEALAGNVHLNPHLIGRIHLERFALSDREGAVTFYETISKLGFLSTSSSLVERRAKSMGKYRRRPLESRTLDNVAALRDLKFGFAKIDVEGHEAAVLTGARETIERNRPIIVIEVLRDADYRRLSDWAATARYVPHAICPGLLLRLDGVEYVAGADNQVLCPAEQLEKLRAVAKRVDLAVA
jgi:FkbM family methyltransferase